jgi:Zn-finger nucleic acid-binding protein
MLCPNCKTETLVTSERQTIQIDHCPRCRGVWLDRGELEKLIQMASTDDGRQSEGSNGREFGEDENAPRGRGSGQTNQDDDDDDDRGNERDESDQSRDKDDDRGDDRGGTYRSREREPDQRGGGSEAERGSIWREIFDKLGEQLPPRS